MYSRDPGRSSLHFIPRPCAFRLSLHSFSRILEPLMYTLGLPSPHTTAGINIPQPKLEGFALLASMVYVQQPAGQ